MRFELDNQSGTGGVFKHATLNAKKQALVVVALCDGEFYSIKMLADGAVALVRKSLELSELKPSTLKYCYVFNKKNESDRAFVEYKLQVGKKTQITDEAGFTSVCGIIDEKQGTGEQPCRIEFGDKQNAIIAVAFCDNELVSGFADAAQAQARGLFEASGVANLATMRYQYALSPPGDESFVEFNVQQGVIIDD